MTIEPGDSISPGIFLSHTWTDKEFVSQLANDLRTLGARVWIDEAEIKLGDSLIEKIRSKYDFALGLIADRLGVAGRGKEQKIEASSKSARISLLHFLILGRVCKLILASGVYGAFQPKALCYGPRRPYRSTLAAA